MQLTAVLALLSLPLHAPVAPLHTYTCECIYIGPSDCLYSVEYATTQGEVMSYLSSQVISLSPLPVLLSSVS